MHAPSLLVSPYNPSLLVSEKKMFDASAEAVLNWSLLSVWI